MRIIFNNIPHKKIKIQKIYNMMDFNIIIKTRINFKISRSHQIIIRIKKIAQKMIITILR